MGRPKGSKNRPKPEAEGKRRPAEETVSEHKGRVWSVILAALGLLLLAIYLIPGAAAWEAVGGFLFKFFGAGCWIICAMLFYISFLLATDGRIKRIYTKLMEMGFVTIFICAFIYTLKAGVGHETLKAAVDAAFAEGGKFGYGFFGALVGFLLTRLGKAPAIIISLIAAGAFFAIMSGKGIANLIALFRRDKSEKKKRVKEKPIPVYIDGHEIPEEATAKTILEEGGKKKRRFNTDVSYFDVDDEEAPPVKPEPTKEQLADLEAIINNLNPAKPAAAAVVSGPVPENISDAAPADSEIVALADKAAAEAGQLDAELAANSSFRPIKAKNYKSPPIDLLKEPKYRDTAAINEELRHTAENLVATLSSFGAEAKVVGIHPGPSITQYELQPAIGVKITRFKNLSDDIALALAAQSIRIEAPIPGKSAIGIEIPNKNVTPVNIREVLESDEFWGRKSNLSVAVGKDITGKVVVADLAEMPHLLIAGTTGSGKSVCINTFLVSLIYKSKPEDVRLLLIDPKRVELGIYNGIPHLLIPVVTDPKKAAGALSWAVDEMMDRYKLFAQFNLRDLASYNEYADKNGLDRLPQIVIFIDELSDMMMVSHKEVEDYICRLAQMARAAGMHLVLATQRPSVDVLTGLIKSNIRSRIAFAVSSQVDSRVILDGTGAEKLLGRGDMLFCPTGPQKQTRVQGCFITQSEVEQVTDYLKDKFGDTYDADIEKLIEKASVKSEEERGEGERGGDSSSPVDELFSDAIDVVVAAGSASTSLLERRLKIGYGRAARIVDEMEERGIVGPMKGSKPRDVLISSTDWAEMKMRMSFDS